MKWPKVRTVLLGHLRLKESWVIFFVLGIIMMNYPFIGVFNKAVLVLGIPLLYLYFLGGWVVSIFVVYLFTKALALPDQRADEKERH